MSNAQTIEEQLNDLRDRLALMGRHDALRRQRILLRIHQLETAKTE